MADAYAPMIFVIVVLIWMNLTWPSTRLGAKESKVEYIPTHKVITGRPKLRRSKILKGR